MDGFIDAAAVDSLVYDQMAALDPDITSKTRIIARWGPYGMPPVVVHPELDSDTREQLEGFFLNLHRSGEGKRILGELDIEEFVIVSHQRYGTIVEMKAALEW